MPFEQIPPSTVQAYDITTGANLTRLPYTSCRWSDGLNAAGSMTVGVDYSKTAARQDLWELLRCWKVILAVQLGDRVLHAGPLTSYTWDAENRGLIDETLQYGPLPITLPPVQGGSYTRTYHMWDLATVSDRITDITNLENGPETRFDPRIKPDGSLTFDLTADPQPTHHQWNTIVPGSRAILTRLDGDGADMTGQVWATGGKDDDKTLMCRRTTTIPTDAGCMFLQTKDTQHTTVSDLTTLQTHALADLAEGAWPAETYTVKVGEEHDVRVGDTADLTVDDDHLGARTIPLKITDVSGDASSDWLTVQAQERTDQ